MKNKFNNLIASLWRAVASHPVELLLLLHATVAVAVNHQEWWLRSAPYATFGVVAALCLSFHRPKRWTQWAYWAVLPIYALCALLPEGWVHTPEMGILYALLVPAYLLATGGKGFSTKFFGMVRSGAVALGVGMLTMWLLLLIYESVFMLFMDERFWDAFPTIFSVSLVLIAPMVFVGMESGKETIEASKLEEALVNWVLTPALLIYNVVLYAYAVYILVRWELPKGSVATMVAAFMVALMAVRWLRPMLTRQPLQWYFRWAGLFALPLVALFWVATVYRIDQYGLTIDRCTLVAIGIAMTVYAVASLFNCKSGGYRFMALSLIVGLLLVCTARPLSMHSQTTVVRHNAAKAGVLSDDGTLRFGESFDKADTIYRVEHRRIYQAMKYMEQDLRDTAIVQQRFGMTSGKYLKHLSPVTFNYAKAWNVDRYGYYDDTVAVESSLSKVSQYRIYSEGEGIILNLDEYSSLEFNIMFYGGKINLADTTLVADSVLAVQLAEIGYTLNDTLNPERIEAYRPQMCAYRSPDGKIFIQFKDYYIDCDTKGNHLDHGKINFALLKQ